MVMYDYLFYGRRKVNKLGSSICLKLFEINECECDWYCMCILIIECQFDQN